MVGEAARLTSLLLALVAACAARAEVPDLVVDGGCRDGLPHGRYELRTGNGELRVAGAFNHGRRTGSFIFWLASGSRIAHIPYDDDVRNGTLATWYESRRRGADPPRRFESMWRRGERDGLTRTWYPDGRRRSETEYARGRLVASIGWSDAGSRVDERAARETAERDARAADAYYAELEALVQTHLPRCD
jgi:hypothetical protein